ncbi:15-hydroxyprostaglandin dehydrogenase [NAD(+)] [Camponotus japonicus]
MDNVHDKTVMITGGAEGLGYKYAEILLLNGAKSVAIIDLPTSNGENAAIALQKESGTERVIFVACDVAKAEDLRKAFEKVIDTFGTIDILINNAGIFDERHKWEAAIDINLKALIHGSYLAVEHMGKYKGGKGGVIVNVSSVLGLSVFPAAPVYTASKHGVLGFSQALAGLYDYTGVQVLIMCPGDTKTKLIDNILDKVIHFIDAKYAEEIVLKDTQSIENAATAMLDLIQKGKNGTVWVSEDDQPSYAVDFPHYSTRSLPV